MAYLSSNIDQNSDGDDPEPADYGKVLEKNKQSQSIQSFGTAGFHQSQGSGGANGASGGVLSMSGRIGSVAQFKNSKLFQKFIQKEQAQESMASPQNARQQLLTEMPKKTYPKEKPIAAAGMGKKKSSQTNLDMKKRLTWDAKVPPKMDLTEPDEVKNKALEETMEHLVPPPKRRIGEDSLVVLTKPIGREVTE